MLNIQQKSILDGNLLWSSEKKNAEKKVPELHVEILSANRAECLPERVEETPKTILQSYLVSDRVGI